MRVNKKILNNINMLTDFPGFLAGNYHAGDATLYVSPGSGLWAGFPLRLLVPSEITEITLRAPRSAP